MISEGEYGYSRKKVLEAYNNGLLDKRTIADLEALGFNFRQQDHRYRCLDDWMSNIINEEDKKRLRDDRWRVRKAYRDGMLTTENIALLQASGFNLETRGSAPKRKKVLSTDGYIFKSVSEAAKHAGYKNKYSLVVAMKEKRLVNGVGYYYEGTKRPIFRKPKGNTPRPVLNTNGDRFPSVKDAFNASGYKHHYSFIKAMKNNQLGIDGIGYWYEDEEKPLFYLPREPHKHVETNPTTKVFKSSWEAEDYFGLRRGEISTAIKRGKKIKGHYFFYSDKEPEK